MKLLIPLLLLAFFNTSFTQPSEICLKPEERKLYKLLMDYRKQKQLPEIPLSYSLTTVAKLHTYDLFANNPNVDGCNLHSWSDKGKWSACCYGNNLESFKCMWNKPQELTNYQGNGYEIAAYSTNMSAKVALDGWKRSSGHNQVMINRGNWKNANWKAVGLAITGNYAVIWFGKEVDPNGAIIATCEEQNINDR